ncbi:MAG TPA: hypothetical protein VEH30_08230 [Terriglobales bacterium]|nr:hypothetical protein [Terriglobales bacterium]
MKATAIDIRQYFSPLLHVRPWRAKLGYGSFLTFEFGPRVKVNGHVHGEWHLWIYLSQWSLLRGNRKLADSDSDRRVIAASVRRLQGVPLSEVLFEQEHEKTTFVFDDFRLVVSPADYLDGTDDRDHYWLLYMPNHQVLTAGPAGIRVGPSDVPDHA